MDNLPTMDKLFASCLYNIVHTFLPLEKGQPLNNGQNARPQCVHYSEVPLYTYAVCRQQKMEEMQQKVEKEQRILSHRIREVCRERRERLSVCVK